MNKKTLTMLTTATVVFNMNYNTVTLADSKRNIIEQQPRQETAEINALNYPELRIEELLNEVDKIAKENNEKDKDKQRIKNVSFDSYDITKTSGISKEELRTVLSSKQKYSNFLSLSDTFWEAEQTYGVNVFALIAIPALESGWNTSNRAKNGHNNIIGMAVEEDSDKGTVYSNKHECIMDLARQLKTYYLTPGANCYNGVSTSQVNKKYSVTRTWYKDVDTIGDELCLTYHQIYGYGE